MSLGGFFSRLYDAVTEHENEDINNKNTGDNNIIDTNIANENINNENIKKEITTVQDDTNKNKINDTETENKIENKTQEPLKSMDFVKKAQESLRGADFVKENVYGEKSDSIEPDIINNKCDVCGIKSSEDNTLGEFTMPVTYAKWSDNYYNGGFMVHSSDRKVRLCKDCVGKLLRSSGRLIETNISTNNNKSEYGLVISEVKPPWDSDSDFKK